MEKILETRHTFLDTQVFIAANFQYDSGHLQKLTSLAQGGRVSLHLTNITIQEIEANIIKAVREAKSAINKVRKDGKILWNSKQPSFECIFAKFETEAIQFHLIEQFHQFLSEGQVDIISVTNVDIDAVFSKYFANTPPFGSGEKKSEFPDAFVIAALEQWSIENNQRMYVVSSDGDMVSACSLSDYLLPLDRVEALIELIIFEDEYVPELVHDLLEAKQDMLDEQIIERFLSLGFWLEDQDGDVEKVTVKSIDALDVYLVDVDKNTASFDLLYRITFSADVSYKDLSYAIYDKEERRYYNVEQINRTIERPIQIPAQVKIGFSREEPYEAELTYVGLKKMEDVGITIEDHDYLYK